MLKSTDQRIGGKAHTKAHASSWRAPAFLSGPNVTSPSCRELGVATPSLTPAGARRAAGVASRPGRTNAPQDAGTSPRSAARVEGPQQDEAGRALGRGSRRPPTETQAGGYAGHPAGRRGPPPGVLGHRDRHLGRGQEPRVVTPACRAYFPFLCVCLTCRRRALTLVSGQALRGQGPRCPAHRE